MLVDRREGRLTQVVPDPVYPGSAHLSADGGTIVFTTGSDIRAVHLGAAASPVADDRSPDQRPLVALSNEVPIPQEA